jgi:hypothetical protein
MSVTAGFSTPDAMSDFYGYARPTYYEVQLCSGGSTYIIQGDITPSVGGVYKLYAPSCIGSMDGSQCWTVLRTQSSGLDCSGVTFGTNYGSCASCNPTFSYYEVQLCSGGSSYIMNPTDVTPVVGGVYKVYAPTFTSTMDGINCWTVIAGHNSGVDDNAQFGTNYGNCVTCSDS